MADRHPVADLLTDEMRARVRDTRFIRVGNRIAAERNRSGRCVCPLGVAVGIKHASQPNTWTLIDRLGIAGPRHGEAEEARRSVFQFVEIVDNAHVDPADVYVMLGCAGGAP